MLHFFLKKALSTHWSVDSCKAESWQILYSSLFLKESLFCGRIRICKIMHIHCSQTAIKCVLEGDIGCLPSFD